MNAPPALAIHRLRSRAAVREPVIARLALTALASDVADSLASLPQLPPQSLLLLRRLTLEIPGLALAHLPDSDVRTEAGRRARSQLATACAGAARPAQRAALGHAPAVLFGDEAELLACLASDALAGDLDRWWWRVLLGQRYPDWPSAWQERPQAVAGALRLLARAGLDAAVRAALGRGEKAAAMPSRAVRPPPAGTVAARSLTTSGAGPAAGQANAAAGEAEGSGIPPAAARVPPRAPPFTAQGQGPASSPPAAQGKAAVGLRPDSERALADATDDRTHDTTAGVAAAQLPPITAAHAGKRIAIDSGDDKAPRSAVRPRPAVAENGASAAAKIAAGPLPPSPAASAAAARRRASIVDDERWPAESTASTSAPGADAPASPPADAADRRKAQATRNGAAQAQQQAGKERTPNTAGERCQAGNEGEASEASAPAESSRHAFAPGARASATTPDQAPRSPLAGTPQAIASRHARLLFLVNILLGDGLYPDFTRPADPGFPLPIWRLLALLGDSLLGSAFRDDPLRRLLEGLAGELAPELGTGFAAGFANNLPERCGRNEANFPRDWPLPQTAQTPLPPRPRLLHRERRDGFARWFACYRQSLRSRLAQALGVPPTLVGRAIVEDDGSALLWVSEASLVVVQPLDRHPLPWRMSGLDRDPGYLPSAGRSLRFVFT